MNVKSIGLADKSSKTGLAVIWVFWALATQTYAQAWIDVATFSGMSMSMPMGGGMGAGGTVFRR